MKSGEKGTDWLTILNSYVRATFNFTWWYRESWATFYHTVLLSSSFEVSNRYTKNPYPVLVNYRGQYPEHPLRNSNWIIQIIDLIIFSLFLFRAYNSRWDWLSAWRTCEQFWCLGSTGSGWEWVRFVMRWNGYLSLPAYLLLTEGTSWVI